MSGAIIIPGQWREQPRGPVAGINRNNRLSDGIQWAVGPFGAPWYDHVYGGPAGFSLTAGTITTAPTPGGLGVSFDGSTYYTSTTNPLMHPLTWLAVGIGSTGTTNYAIGGAGNLGSNDTRWQLDQFGGNLRSILVDTVPANTGAASVPVADGELYAAVFIAYANKTVATFKGRQKATASNAIGTVAGWTGYRIGVLPQNTISGYRNKPMLLNALWNRALSDAEAFELCANPWQIFSHRFTTRRIYFGSAAATGTTITPAAGSLTFTGYAPTLNLTMTPAVGALTLGGLQPTVSQGTILTPSVGTLTLSGTTSTMNFGMTPTQGTLTFNGYAPTVSASGAVNITPAVGSLTINGLAPSMDLGITPGVGALAIAGLQPSISLNTDRTPSAGTLTFAGLQPSITVTTAVSVPDVGALALTGYQPIIVNSTPISVGGHGYPRRKKLYVPYYPTALEILSMLEEEERRKRVIPAKKLKQAASEIANIFRDLPQTIAQQDAAPVIKKVGYTPQAATDLINKIRLRIENENARRIQQEGIELEAASVSEPYIDPELAEMEEMAEMWIAFQRWSSGSRS